MFVHFGGDKWDSGFGFFHQHRMKKRGKPHEKGGVRGTGLPLGRISALCGRPAENARDVMRLALQRMDGAQDEEERRKALEMAKRGQQNLEQAIQEVLDTAHRKQGGNENDTK